MKNYTYALAVAAIVPALTLAGCGKPADTKDTGQPAESSTVSPSPAQEGPQESSTPVELKKQLTDVDGVKVSEIGDHLEVSFKASEAGDSLDHQATLDIVLAASEYTKDYEYVMVIGNEPKGTFAYSYDKSTVDEIAKMKDPVVSKIWDIADRAVDPR